MIFSVSDSFGSATNSGSGSLVALCGAPMTAPSPIPRLQKSHWTRLGTNPQVTLGHWSRWLLAVTKSYCCSGVAREIEGRVHNIGGLIKLAFVDCYRSLDFRGGDHLYVDAVVCQR